MTIDCGTDKMHDWSLVSGGCPLIEIEMMFPHVLLFIQVPPFVQFVTFRFEALLNYIIVYVIKI